ncbi:MAG TPA: hypothetical protein VI027_09780 [Rubrobacteraceae bacterium]
MMVGFAHTRFPDGEGTPSRSKARAVEALPSATDQPEDPPDPGHVPRLHLVAGPRLVVAKTVPGRVAADDLPLPGLPPAASLRRLRPLELGELVEDAVGELALGAIVSPIVHGPDLRSMLLELAP